MFNFPPELRMHIACFLDPTSLIDLPQLCKEPFLDQSDDATWQFVSTMHFREYPPIKNYSTYKQIYSLERGGLFYIVETKLEEFIYESKWARDWLEKGDSYIDACIQEIMRKKYIIKKLREYEAFMKGLCTFQQERHDVGIAYTLYIDEMMRVGDQIKHRMNQYAQIHWPNIYLNNS